MTRIIFVILVHLLIFAFLIWLCRVVIQTYFKITSSRCRSNTYLGGKTALITGGNSGIGFQTALALAGRGCRVIIADKDNCEKSKEKIIEETGNCDIVIKKFDLASLASVRELAKDINETEKHLDILINNAGTSGLKNTHTKDGLHIGMQVNHFGGFLLTHLLIDLLKKSQPSRIVFVSSDMSFFNNLTKENLNWPEYPSATRLSDIRIYCNTKLCNIITAKILAKKLSRTGITANAAHPGLVYTQIYSRHTQSHDVHPYRQKLFYDYFLRYFGKTPEEGAQTVIHLAIAKEVEELSGKYFGECRIKREPRKARDEKFCRDVFRASEDLVKLAPEEKL